METSPSIINQSSAVPHHGNGVGIQIGDSHFTSNDVRGQFGRYYVRNSDGRRDGAFEGEQRDRKQPHPVDRPKKKDAIPGCSPWLLITTKLRRRFVFNPETKESLWKFPLEVMKGVVEFDRLERERKANIDRDGHDKNDDAMNADFAADTKEKNTAATEISARPSTTAPRAVDDESDEYEEVEVTDEEAEGHSPKRQKTEEDHRDQPVDFNEDDIAYQLAAMGEDYGLDPGEYGNHEDAELEEGAEGLALTEEDSNALFKDMLNDFNISPYTTWEKIIEDGSIVADDRYTVLPNMRSRKGVWADWSRKRLQQLKEQREREVKENPKISYLMFLEKYATPKLYWPEFRRKYKKEAEMRDSKFPDKEREKLYRDYINRKVLHLHSRHLSF